MIRILIVVLLTAASASAYSPVELGRMTRFYRGQAVLGERYSSGGLQPGGDICRVSDYLTDSTLDFPYLSKGTPEELMFTDYITAVRFLGGIADHRIPLVDERNGALDLAVRDREGSIRYNWKPLARFDQYVQLFGEDITIVLDCVPAAFVSVQKSTSYGQFNPPDDYSEWQSFLGAMCKVLSERYGFDVVNRWRFRVLTEGRLNVDTDQFLRHYNLTTQAIRKVLPGARFLAYNVPGVHIPEHHHINYYEFIQKIASEDGAFPLAGHPVSYYSVPLLAEEARANPMAVAYPDETGTSSWTASPVVRVQTDYKPFWDHMDSMLGHSLPREIQELGILKTESGLRTSEPGARGAAWLYQLLFSMWQDAGVSRIWHWHTTDVLALPDRDPLQRKRLLRSNGWLYQILDHTVGAQVYNLPVQQDTECSPKLTLRCDLFLRADNGFSYLILSGFHVERSFDDVVPVSVEIPQNLAVNLAEIKGACSMNPQTDVYQIIRDDLLRQGELVGSFVERPLCLSIVCGEDQPTDGMATPAGVALIDRDFERYAKQIQSTLTLKPFDGIMQISGTGDMKITTRLRVPETLVLVWKTSK